MAYRRKPVKGLASAKQMLRLFPAAVNAELVSSMETSGKKILAAMKGRTPKRTGALQAGLSQKVFAKTLRMEVGLRGTKLGGSKLFYGRIIDRGFGPKFPLITRRLRNSKKLSKPYVMKMPGMVGLKFITGRYTDLRTEMSGKLQGIFARARAQLPLGFDD